MPLVHYDPFSVLKRDFGSFPALPNWFDTEFPHFSTLSTPRIDVRENQSEVIVTAEIPGIEKREDVQITVHDNHLHLSGTVNRVTEEHDENVHRTERFYGQFSRTIGLPSTVEDNGAKASYKNGILEIRIPKAATQIGRQIDVDFH